MTSPIRSTRDAEAGVSLVEMLVALALFAMVGLASFATLDAIIKSRARTEDRLAEVGAIDRALLLFGRDLQQARPGSVSGSESALAIADRALVLSWRWDDGRLIRQQTDGLLGTAGVAQSIGPEFGQMRLRYLDAARDWHDRWPDDSAGAEPLTGVELILERAAAPGEIRTIVVVAETVQ